MWLFHEDASFQACNLHKIPPIKSIPPYPKKKVLEIFPIGHSGEWKKIEKGEGRG